MDFACDAVSISFLMDLLFGRSRADQIKKSGMTAKNPTYYI